MPEPVFTVETRLGCEEVGSFGGRAGTEPVGRVCAGAWLKLGCMGFKEGTTEKKEGKNVREATIFTPLPLLALLPTILLPTILCPLHRQRLTAGA